MAGSECAGVLVTLKAKDQIMAVWFSHALKCSSRVGHCMALGGNYSYL